MPALGAGRGRVVHRHRRHRHAGRDGAGRAHVVARLVVDAALRLTTRTVTAVAAGTPSTTSRCAPVAPGFARDVITVLPAKLNSRQRLVSAAIACVHVTFRIVRGLGMHRDRDAGDVGVARAGARGARRACPPGRPRRRAAPPACRSCRPVRPCRSAAAPCRRRRRAPATPPPVPAPPSCPRRARRTCAAPRRPRAGARRPRNAGSVVPRRQPVVPAAGPVVPAAEPVVPAADPVGAPGLRRFRVCRRRRRPRRATREEQRARDQSRASGETDLHRGPPPLSAYRSLMSTLCPTILLK